MLTKGTLSLFEDSSLPHTTPFLWLLSECGTSLPLVQHWANDSLWGPLQILYHYLCLCSA